MTNKTANQTAHKRPAKTKLVTKIAAKIACKIARAIAIAGAHAVTTGAVAAVAKNGPVPARWEAAMPCCGPAATARSVPWSRN